MVIPLQRETKYVAKDWWKRVPQKRQKMLAKLPEWVTSRWNRYVTEQLDRGQEYPSFHEFASYIAKEARIACNPVSSLHALRHSTETPVREVKRSW